MTYRHLILWLAGLSVCGLALAQWQWVDQDGRTVYSDRPPAADLPVKNVQKKGAVLPSQTPLQQPADTPVPLAPANGARDDLPALKKRASETEQARQKAEKQQNDVERAESCKQARQNVAALQNDNRVSHQNAAGEREFLDEAQRAQELQRAQNGVRVSCN